jgi:ATP-dependent RNA helicase RhlB
VVIDEADRMFDLGFIKDLRYILRQLPPFEKRQTMLFSATLSPRVMELAYEFMNLAERVKIAPEQVTVERVEQILYHVSRREKFPFLLGLLRREVAMERVMLFVNTKREAEHLAERLNANDCKAAVISGDIDQRKRLRLIDDFKAGRLYFLVATDVASRGLHIDDVTHVINYDLPQDAEDYVHRIGRTARAGAKGKAISLADEDLVFHLPEIEEYLGIKIPAHFRRMTISSGITGVPRPGARCRCRRKRPPTGNTAGRNAITGGAKGRRAARGIECAPGFR